MTATALHHALQTENARSSVTHEQQPASQQIPGRPLGFGINIALRQDAEQRDQQRDEPPDKKLAVRQSESLPLLAKPLHHLKDKLYFLQFYFEYSKAIRYLLHVPGLYRPAGVVCPSIVV